MKEIEIKIDPATLPIHRRKVEFFLLKQEVWKKGFFEENSFLFVIDSRRWWSPWEVIKWKYID